MKIAIITGAGGNLGQAIAKKFADEQYRVIGTISPREAGDTGPGNGRITKTMVNLADEASAAAFVDEVIAKHERIDVAVLTVGGFAMGSIAETSTSDIASQYRMNFETTYNIARPVFNQMMSQKEGRIFLVGSRPGSDMRQSKGMVAYGLTKSLIFRLAELMNEEARGTNVVVTVLVPATIDTPQNRKAMPDADTSRWVQPAAIAEVVFRYSQDEMSIVREPVVKVYGRG